MASLSSLRSLPQPEAAKNTKASASSPKEVEIKAEIKTDRDRSALTVVREIVARAPKPKSKLVSDRAFAMWNGHSQTNPNGDVMFYDKDGLLHNDADSPACEFADGGRAWYQHGKLSRAFAPAYLGPKPQKGETREEIWSLNGLPHRENGPSVTYSNGNRLYHLHGKSVVDEQTLREVVRRINIESRQNNIKRAFSSSYGGGHQSRRPQNQPAPRAAPAPSAPSRPVVKPKGLGLVSAAVIQEPEPALEADCNAPSFGI